MDIIEKETVKEVPTSYWEKHYGCNSCCTPYYGNNYQPFAYLRGKKDKHRWAYP